MEDTTIQAVSVQWLDSLGWRKRSSLQGQAAAHHQQPQQPYEGKHPDSFRAWSEMTQAARAGVEGGRPPGSQRSLVFGLPKAEWKE